MLDGQALLTTDRGGSRGGLVRGMTLDDLRALHPVSDHIVAGKLDDFTGDDAIAIGIGLAQSYQLRIGDPLTVISPQGAATAFGTVPRVRAYKVVAVFDAGLNDYNNSVVFMPLPAAQIFFQKPDAITGIEIRVTDPDNVDALVPPLHKAVGGRKVWLRDWRHANDTIIGVLAGAEGHHVHRARHDRAGRGVQRDLVADHDGEGQDARHRRAAHAGRRKLRGAAHLPDVRRVRRRHRHA